MKIDCYFENGKLCAGDVSGKETQPHNFTMTDNGKGITIYTDGGQVFACTYENFLTMCKSGEIHL